MSGSESLEVPGFVHACRPLSWRSWHKQKRVLCHGNNICGETHPRVTLVKSVKIIQFDSTFAKYREQASNYYKKKGINFKLESCK